MLALTLAFAAAVTPLPPPIQLDASKPAGKRGFAGAVDAVLARHSWDDSFGGAFAAYAPYLVNETLWPRLLSVAKKHSPVAVEDLTEVQAAFARHGHDVPLGYLVSWLYFHETGHADGAPSLMEPECLGVLTDAAGGANATVHGRNMDREPKSAPYLRRIALAFNATTKHGLSYLAADHYWFAGGFMTAVMRGACSLSENWRFKSRPLADILASLEAGATPQLLIFRGIFENATSPPAFAECVDAVTNAPLAASMYAVVGGPARGEGVVVSRGQDAPAPERMNGRLVISNYDPGAPDPPSDPRATIARGILGNMTDADAGSRVGVFAVASSTGVRDATVYTAVMSAREGSLFVVAQDN